MTTRGQDFGCGLAGKVALVTGASRGLGFEIARGLAGAGASVIVHGRNVAELREAEAAIRQAGGQAAVLPLDLDDEATTRRACDDIAARHGTIDIIVNNAGARDRRPLEQLDRAAFRRVLETNLVAPFDLIRLLLPHMPAGGRIVNITSIAGPLARAGDPIYTAAKGGLDALTRALSAELGCRGITVNAVAPGYFATSANAAMAADAATGDYLKRRSSLGRWGRPDEIVAAVLFLCSPAASYVSGTTIPVDGGYMSHF